MGAALFILWAAQDSNPLCFHVPVLQTGATPPSWRAANSVPWQELDTQNMVKIVLEELCY